MFCPHCGNENDNNSAFCGTCGKPIEASRAVGATAVQTATPVITKTAAPAKTKKASPIISKEAMRKVGLALLLTVLYAGISTLFILLPELSNTITVKSVLDSDISGQLSLKELLNVLISGNKIFNPTAISTAVGVGVYILIYSVPAFAAIALIGTFIGKRGFSLYIVSSVITVLTSAATIAAAPVALKFIPDFKQALAASVGLLFDDIGKLTFTLLIIFAAAALVLIVISGIVTAMFNKRRAQK